MSVGSIIGGGIRLVRTQPQVVAIWAALYLLLAAIGLFAMRPLFAAMIAFQQQMLAFQQQAAIARAAGLAPPAPPAAMGQFMSDIFGLDFIFLILAIIAFAAVVRAVAWPTGDRFAYLRLGMDEVRLMGLGLLLLVAGAVIEVVAIIAVMLVGFLVGLVAGKGAIAAVAGIAAFVLFCGAIYLEVRISLAGVFTVIRRRIVIGEAWRATKGRFWTLFGVYALLTIAYLVLTVVIVAISNPHLLTAYATMDQPAMIAAAQEQMAWLSGGIGIGLIAQMALFAVIVVVFGAVACGAITTAALELAPAPEPVGGLY